MTQKLQPVRGTHDILPAKSAQRRELVNQAIDVFSLYGFGEIATPIFEFSEVFHRTLGDVSDVVTKETYSFTDRGGEALTLRPEFTAAVVRAFISNGLQETLPFKVFYHGPAFRYERPQQGRLRQFHQIGAELLGIAGPQADVEMIAMSVQLLKAFGIFQHCELRLNSLGDQESRLAYRAALVSYFMAHQETLSEESRIRLEKNPLRILDSKQEAYRAICANAPRLAEYYTPHAANFYQSVKDSLTLLGIPYVEDSRLVRGLDYYSHTVFEFVGSSLGAQNTVLAGGRYDGLVKLMGGPDTPGVGFAAGIERLLALIEIDQPEPPADTRLRVAVIAVDTPQEAAALTLAHKLREEHVACEFITQGNMGKRMKRAERCGARFTIIIGEEELQKSEVMVKDMQLGSQQKMSHDALFSKLKGMV